MELEPLTFTRSLLQIVNVVKVILDNLKLVTNDLETKEIKNNKLKKMIKLENIIESQGTSPCENLFKCIMCK